MCSRVPERFPDSDSISWGQKGERDKESTAQEHKTSLEEGKKQEKVQSGSQENGTRVQPWLREKCQSILKACLLPGDSGGLKMGKCPLGIFIPCKDRANGIGYLVNKRQEASTASRAKDRPLSSIVIIVLHIFRLWARGKKPGKGDHKLSTECLLYSIWFSTLVQSGFQK